MSKNKTFTQQDKNFVYTNFPDWLLTNYRNVKNYRDIKKSMSYIPDISGIAKRRKGVNFVEYIKTYFNNCDKLVFYIEQYNEHRFYQKELGKELYKVIHYSRNFTRCVEVIYNHLVNLDRKLANRLEIEDILDTTDYSRYVVSYYQTREEIKRINKQRRKLKIPKLTEQQTDEMWHKKELAIINYVGSLINKEPLEWNDLIIARCIYKLDNYSYKPEQKQELIDTIIELGGKY